MTNAQETNNGMNFSQLLRMWLDTNSIKHKSSTDAKYQWMIEKHIIPKLGDTNIDDINACKINNFLKDKLENGRLDGTGGLSSGTVRSISLIIDSALRFGSEELSEWTSLKTPIYKPYPTKKHISILTKDEQVCLERYICDHITGTGAGVIISLYTGLRVGEICALRWADIDLKENIVHVNHTLTRTNSYVIGEPKTRNSRRKIPLNSFLLSFLNEFKNNSGSDFVVSEKSSFVCPRTYEYRFHKLLEECGVGDINYHALRHTFATRCIECGCDYKTLSEILGHASVRITLETYVHSSMELKRAEMEKLVR